MRKILRNSYLMNEHLIFHRCIFAAIKEMKHVTALVVTYLYLAIGFTVVVLIPNYKSITGSEGRKVPLQVGGIFLYIVLPIIVGILWYLRYHDLGDEIYEVTPDDIIRVTYKTWGQFTSPREGRVHRVDNGHFVRRGLSQNLFNWGDVVLQVGWSRDPFILKDVYKPARVLALILHRARQEPIVVRESALAGAE